MLNRFVFRISRARFGRLPFVAAIALVQLTFAAIARADSIAFKVRGSDGQQLPCRIHLSGTDGQPIKASGQPFWNDHFVCDGDVKVDVPTGQYAWVIERGPEYKRAKGTISTANESHQVLEVQLDRITHLRQHHWYSADLHVHRPASDIEQLMMAEDLDYAPVIQWWNTPAQDTTLMDQIDFQFDGHRVYTLLAGEDERQGGALLYFGLNRPLNLTVRSREVPSPMQFVGQARRLNEQVWIDIEKPFWWDVPTWIASGKMNSIGIANNHMNRAGMLASEAWGRPRDRERLPDPLGNGYWTQEIYYHLLDAGIRIPPSAGSASGVLKNPVGYNRVYVQLQDQPFTRENWFKGLAAGRCFVTNGPLLRVKANDEWPGTTVTLKDRAEETLELEIDLDSNDPIANVEVIANGRVVKRIPCTGSTEQHLRTSFQMKGPGWFLVRVIAENDSTFRFASTAPWYVETPTTQRRISATSARFFLTWLDERTKQLVDSVSEPGVLREILSPHEQARAFWLSRLEAANAESDGDSESQIETTSASLSDASNH